MHDSNDADIVSQARAGIQPPADAIEEFKVETAAYDAQIGHTGAGAVNLLLKTGTNQFHGSASYYNRDDSRSENLFASEKERLQGCSVKKFWERSALPA